MVLWAVSSGFARCVAGEVVVIVEFQRYVKGGEGLLIGRLRGVVGWKWLLMLDLRR